MGYYVRITKSTAIIPAENKATVLQIWKDLNKPENNHLKRGGSYTGGEKVKHWYSWMSENYDETCHSVEEILEQLGFESTLHDNGDVSIDDYDSKTGQEELFLKAVENLLIGEIQWVGEENECWTTNFYGHDVIQGEVITKSLPHIA